MAGALYVSNPRRKRRSKRSRNPAFGDGGGWHGGFGEERSTSRASAIAKDVARILEGRPPMTAGERRIAREEAKLASMQTRIAKQARMAQAVRDLEPEAMLLAGREIALKRALRAVGGSSSSKRKRKSSKRKTSRRTRRTSRRMSNPLSGLSFSGLTLSNPRRGRKGKRRGSKSRRYSRMPARGRKGRFVASSRRGRSARGRRSRNPLTISNPMSGIPVIGTAIALIGPALLGAVAGEGITQGVGLVRKYVTVPAMVEPFQNTIFGLLGAGAIQLITPIPAPIRTNLGVAFASVGAAMDWLNYRKASGAYAGLDLGDGGAWSVEYGDGEAFGALDMSGIDFSGDEDYCGADFSMDEGMAAAEGYGAYHARFPLKGQGRHLPVHAQHDPRREGDRFHWLARLVGPEEFKRIANMPPEARVAMIHRCKMACKSALNAPASAASQRLLAVDHLENQGSNLPDPHSLASVPFSQDSWAI